MTMKLTIALLTSALFPLTSAAQGVLLDDIVDPAAPEMPELRQYSVEVIVFAYAEDVHVGTEVFVPEVLPEPELLYDENGFPILESIDGEPLDENALDGEPINEETGLPLALDEDGADEVSADGEDALAEPEIEEPVTFTFELMLEEDYELVDTLTRLDELDAYEPLMHFGWIQGMLPDEETEVLSLDTFATPPYGLDGELTLYLSRYLHLVVDLELAAEREEGGEFDDAFGGSAGDGRNPFQRSSTDDREPQPVPTYTDRRMFGWDDYAEPEEPRYAPLMYRISEDRIVRNGEVRYYDHPKFGVIARIVRIEAEEESEQPEDAEGDGTQPASALVQ